MSIPPKNFQATSVSPVDISNALAAADEFLHFKRLCGGGSGGDFDLINRLLAQQLRTTADCDAFVGVDGVAYKLAGYLAGRRADEALLAGHLLLRLTARCSANSITELLRQAGPYCIGHATGGGGLIQRLCLIILINCCRASVALGGRLVRLGLLDACLIGLRLVSVKWNIKEVDDDNSLLDLYILGLVRLSRLCCLAQSRALRDLVQPRLVSMLETVRRLCQRAADRLAAGIVDPALCQPFFAACCLQQAFLTAPNQDSQPMELLTPQHPVLLANLATSIDQSSEASAAAVSLGRGLRCCAARSAYLVSADAASSSVQPQLACELVRQLAELAVRHQASVEAGDLLVAVVKLASSIAESGLLSEVAGSALLRLGTCAPNWLGRRGCGLTEMALRLAADQLIRMPESNTADASAAAELSNLVTACQACLGSSLPSAAAAVSADGGGIGDRILVPTLHLLALIKRRLGADYWLSLTGGNRLLNRLLADCSGLVASAAEHTAYLMDSKLQ